ncbi:MAG: 4-alpha-glucanotransferase, partial [Pseudomonadota bacterium]
FVGLNPLHALFTAEPERASPFAPSDRAFLNPLIIAVDAVPGYTPALLGGRAVPGAQECVDYARVGPLKLAVLADVFDRWATAASPEDMADHQRFVAERGEALQSFATFEALSHTMAAAGHGAGTRAWPADIATRTAPGAQAFASRHPRAVAFHVWLQYVADRQLANAQASARRAGMRIGLYLDLAVGTAPDGHATWCAPDLSLTGLTIGAPPDLFSTEGQSWGLAPMSPAALAAADYAPFRAVLAAVMRHAGAVRIDHAMGLERLWLVPDGDSAKAGAYVRQPRLVDEVIDATHRHGTLAIGEDLGIVPPGFRERMDACRLFSMRIMMFERDGHRFRAPGRYPVDALACLSTHDFAPLEAWWDGDDLAIREALGTLSSANAAAERADRHRTKTGLLGLMGLPPGPASGPLDDRIRVAYHRAVARTPCRVMSVRLEDVVGGRRLVNLPGTDREHPNWRRTLPLDVEGILASPVLRQVLDVVRQARTR